MLKMVHAQYNPAKTIYGFYEPLYSDFDIVKLHEIKPNDKFIYLFPYRSHMGYGLSYTEQLKNFVNVFRHIPPVVRNAAKQMKCIIVFDDTYECMMDGLMSDALDAFCDHHKIDKSCVLFLTGGQFEPRNVVFEEIFNEIVSNSFNHLRDKPFYHRPVKSKMFLCYNRHWNFNREFIVQRMFNDDLLKHGLVSLADDRSFFKSGLQENFLATLPLVLDEPVGLKSKNLAINMNIPHYMNSYLSVVNESYFAQFDNRIFPTEKIYKTMAVEHPFIVNAGCGFLAYLRGQGYKTFHPYIDESYDQVFNTSDRIIATHESLRKFISDINGQNKINILREIKQIAQFNKQWLFNRPRKERNFVKIVKERLSWQK